MAVIDLFEPVVFRDTVHKMQNIPDHYLLKSIPKVPNQEPTVAWTILRGNRNIAVPNIPNSEAHIVAQSGREAQTAGLVYLREKKVFEPTTLRWIKAAENSANPNTVSAAEEAVMREVTDLNNRFDTFWEWTLWQALQGSLTFTNLGGVTANVDYLFQSSHKPTYTWTPGTTKPADIVANFKAWRKLVQVDGETQASDVYATTPTLDKIIQVFIADPTANKDTLLSDRMKDEYFTTGTVNGFLGLNWHPIDSFYTNAAGASTNFLPDGTVILANLTDGRPVELAQGPSADDSAPEGFVGRFAKTWKEEDPSARQYLIEENALPVIRRPEQIVVATAV
jgi:hypothetical protein